jgi:hypothetical protein
MTTSIQGGVYPVLGLHSYFTLLIYDIKREYSKTEIHVSTEKVVVYQTPFWSISKSIGLQSNPPATSLVSDKNRTCNTTELSIVSKLQQKTSMSIF